MKTLTHAEAIGNAIRRARKGENPREIRMGQTKLSARVRQRRGNLQQPMLSRYEKGIVAAPAKTVELIERELGLERGDIYRMAFDNGTIPPGEDTPGFLYQQSNHHLIPTKVAA